MRPKVPFRRCRLTWGGDPAEACVVVILMMVQDGDDNLNQKVLEAQAQMTAKQTIRAMFAQLNQIEAMLTQYGGTPIESMQQLINQLDAEYRVEATTGAPVPTTMVVSNAPGLRLAFNIHK